MEADDELILELYLEDNSYCIRSIASCGEPYFEVENVYDNRSEQILKAIEDCQIDDQIIKMFDGVDEKTLEMGVHCIITDNRIKDHSSDRCLVLRRTCYFASYSSDDSEPSISYDSDDCSQ